MEDDHQEKENESISSSYSHQATLPPPPPPFIQPSSSPSSSTEPEHFQRAKKTKLTDPQTHLPSQTDQVRSQQPPNSCPAESPLQAAAAQLRLMKSKERAEYKLTLVGGQPSTKKSKRQRRPNRGWIPPGPSPLGPGPSPYERVKKVVTILKNYLKLDSPSGPQLHEAPMTLSVAKPTLEKVILMLDEYMKGISSSVTDEEMEELFRVFQKSVNVDDEEICWYDLIKISNEAFWKSLTEHFVCETFFESDFEEDDDDMEEEDDDYDQWW